jgi:hypothetical protein
MLSASLVIPVVASAQDRDRQDNAKTTSRTGATKTGAHNDFHEWDNTMRTGAFPIQHSPTLPRPSVCPSWTQSHLAQTGARGYALLTSNPSRAEVAAWRPKARQGAVVPTIGLPIMTCNVETEPDRVSLPSGISEGHGGSATIAEQQPARKREVNAARGQGSPGTMRRMW